MNRNGANVCGRAILSAESYHPGSVGNFTEHGLIMKRADLEHIIRAAGAIAETTELVVLGSQSILGLYPSPPLSRSWMRANLVPFWPLNPMSGLLWAK